MKKDRNNKEDWMNGYMALFLAAVLIIGTGGLVYGDSAEDTSEITVTATGDAIEIDDVTYTNNTEEDQDIIDDNEQGDNFGYSESDPAATDGDAIEFSVQVTVLSDDMDDLDEATITISVQEGEHGDAMGEFEQTWTNTDWAGEEETLNHDFTTDDEDSFLRYGDWEIKAELFDDQDSEVDSEHFGEALSAETHVEITDNVEDVDGSVTPGETIGTYDLGENDLDDDGTDPTIEFEINSAWDIDMGDATLTGPGEDIDSEEYETGYNDGTDYVEEDDEPVEEYELEVHYKYDVQEGQPPGEYTAEDVTHTVSNTEANSE